MITIAMVPSTKTRRSCYVIEAVYELGLEMGGRFGA